MRHSSAQSYLLNRTFADADDLAHQVRQWDLEFMQLDRGKFRGRLVQFGVGGVHISDARFCRALKQSGAPPAGMRTIAVLASGDLHLQWRGKTVDGGSLMVFPRGAELAGVTRPDFHVYTCSFPESLVAALSDALGLGDLDEMTGGVDAIRIAPPAIEDIRRRLRRLSRVVSEQADALASAVFRQELTCELPSRLITAVSQARVDCPAARGSKRRSAIARAENYIARHAAERIEISDICQAAEVSERTLRYAFVERYGIGPKEFLNAYRLNEARRVLRHADPSATRVADVANSWGFWHMGQFAADYRQRFDELPSETLQRRGG